MLNDTKKKIGASAKAVQKYFGGYFGVLQARSKYFSVKYLLT